MATSVQSVLKNIPEVIRQVPSKIALHIALILMSSERKNYASMARANGISYGKVYIKSDDAAEEFTAVCAEFLQSLIKYIAAETDKGYLIIDFTVLLKRFAECIPNVTYDYDGVSKRVEKGLSLALVVWSNGTITIPFNIDFWLKKKDAGELYRKKTEIAQQLVLLAIKHGIPVKEVRLDGAFASVEMMLFLIKHKIDFTMRIHNNRVVVSAQGKHKLSEQPKLKMKRNEKFKTIRASYKGIKKLYFTAHKRKCKNDESEVVYIVSTVKRKPKDHVKAYSQRWPVEKKIRTSKQHLGATHCQSMSKAKQKFHIFSVMVSYAILQLAKIDKRKKSVEEILHLIRRQKQYNVISRYIDLERTFVT
jgi:hypothetical protein